MRERFIAVTNGRYDERSTLWLKLIRARPSVNLVKSGRKPCWRFTTGHFIHPRSVAVRRSRFFALFRGTASPPCVPRPGITSRRCSPHSPCSLASSKEERAKRIFPPTRKRIISGWLSLRCHPVTKRNETFIFW